MRSTVDGKHPAPVEMANVTGFFDTSQVVQGFSHQQLSPNSMSQRDLCQQVFYCFFLQWELIRGLSQLVSG